MLQLPETCQTQILQSIVVQFDVHEIALRSATEFSSSIWSFLPGSYQTQVKSLCSQTPAAEAGELKSIYLDFEDRTSHLRACF